MTDFDRIVGTLEGLPDVRHTRPSTVSSTHPLLGNMATFVVQTWRQKDVGDTILLQFIDSEGGDRLVIPPAVADAISRQREALTKANRRASARATMERRMAEGYRPQVVRPHRKAAGQ